MFNGISKNDYRDMIDEINKLKVEINELKNRLDNYKISHSYNRDVLFEVLSAFLIIKDKIDLLVDAPEKKVIKKIKDKNDFA